MAVVSADLRRPLVCWLSLLLWFCAFVESSGQKVAQSNSKVAKAPRSGGPRGLAVVSVLSPPSLVGRYLGVFGEFTGGKGLGETHSALHITDGSRGCSATEGNSSKSSVVIVDRGNCTFELKAHNAEKAGASGVIVVLDSDEVMVMGGSNDTTAEPPSIFAVAVQQSLGRLIEKWESQPQSQQEVLQILVEPYVPHRETLLEQLMDPSLGAQILVATGLVAAGAFYATSDLRSGSPFSAPPKDSVFEIQWFHSLAYCAVGSGMLVVMYFLMKYLIYVIIFAFSIGGSFAILQMGSAVLGYFAPRLRQVVIAMPDMDISVDYADIIAGLPTLGVLFGFLWMRNTQYGFIFQDTLGAGFLCSFQRTLRLPNLKVASLLLWAMFFFDIFWVFLSPMLFQKSVMVEVATGAGTGEAVPMLIRMPSTSSSHTGERMLGFGDIALPGLLLSYLLRFDMMHAKKRWQGYFSLGLFSYAFGLTLTMLANVVTGAGQPALLYLVPSTLGSVTIVGCCRKELGSLNEGFPSDATEATTGGAVVAVTDSPQHIHRRGPPREGGSPEEEC